MKVPIAIPDAMRKLVRARDRSSCGRCGATGVELSHRRSRQVRDEHTHCLCNLVMSCSTCGHEIAHNQPHLSRREGWVVRKSGLLLPFQVPMLYRTEWVMLTCAGAIRSATPEEVAEHEQAHSYR